MNTTDFDDIENQKENIEPLREGRSAAALSKSLGRNPLEARTSQQPQRDEFEKQIAESAELDDPIEPYLDYIKWINEEYPQGQNAESGLLQVLERCTSDFRDAAFYKDDSRYLKVWMQYIKYYDAPKEIFTYLSRKNIGRGLALFYEEYAAYLETVGKRGQADEVYQIGLEANARPIERLKRRYKEFQDRLAANPPDSNEPSSPVMPAVRPALAQKGFAVGGLDEHKDESGEKSKLPVFTDNGESSQQANSSSAWDHPGTLASRRKENTIEAQQWAGEKLKQSSEAKSSKTLSVFRDAPAAPPAPGKRAEKVAVAMDFINVNGEEFCLEEVLAKSRKVYHNIYPRAEQHADSTVPLKGDSPAKAPRSPTMTLHTKAATDEVYEMFNQPLQSSSDDSDAEDNTGYGYDYTETRLNDDQGMINNVVTQTDELTIDEQCNNNNVPQTPAREKLAYALPAMTPIAEATETLTHTMKQAARYYGNPLIDGKLLNPIQQSVQLHILSNIDPPLDTYPGYHEFDKQFGREDAVIKSIKRQQQPTIELACGDLYNVKKVLGTGGFGSVYLAESELGDLKALKVQRESNPWEYYILRSLKSRLAKSRDLESIVQSSSLYVYNDETWMILDYFPQGTILDLVNLANSQSNNGGLEECLALFFAIEVLRVVESIHSVGVLHCDIKPDNVMVRLNPIPEHEWSKYYSRDGSNKWSEKGVMIIDFGRAADMTVLDPQVQFTADWKMDEQDCAEMRNSQPWTYQADYYGVASIVHLMLFGKFISTMKNSDGMYRVQTPLKRYWQKDLWEELFSILLNPEFHGTLPIISVLSDCRNKLAERLETMCESNGTSLKASLLKLETELWSRRPKIR